MSRTGDIDVDDVRCQLGLISIGDECAIITASVARLGKGLKTPPRVMRKGGAVTVGGVSLLGLRMACCGMHRLGVL